MVFNKTNNTAFSPQTTDKWHALKTLSGSILLLLLAVLVNMKQNSSD